MPVVGCLMSSQKLFILQFLLRINVNIFGKMIFVDLIKDLEMRLSWIIKVGSKSNDKCPISDMQRRDAQGK